VRILRETPSASLRTTAAWALSNLAKGAGTSAEPFFNAGLFDVIAEVFAHLVGGPEG
jgi:hypothetical protein